MAVANNCRIRDTQGGICQYRKGSIAVGTSLGSGRLHKVEFGVAVVRSVAEDADLCFSDELCNALLLERLDKL